MKYKIGDRITFTGFTASSFDYPDITIGESGTIINVKQPDQIGHDYWVDFGSGRRFALNENELELYRTNFEGCEKARLSNRSCEEIAIDYKRQDAEFKT